MFDWREAVRAAAGVILCVVLLVVVVVGLARCAAAHQASSGWQYPHECCHDRGCAEIPASDVREVPGGFLYVPTGEVVAQSTARISPDGRWHLCRLSPSSPILCFFYPPPGY